MILNKQNQVIQFGLAIPPLPPISQIRQLLLMLRASRHARGIPKLCGGQYIDSLLVWDHHQHLLPNWLYQEQVWNAGPSAHAFMEWSALLTGIASSAGNIRLGVAATDPFRNSAVEIAKKINTVAHFTKQSPIMVIGSGEAMNLTPYGYSFDQAATRVDALEAALPIIRHYLDSEPNQPLTKDSDDIVGLRAPVGQKPVLWVGGSKSRTRSLVGKYADGWYPLSLISPTQYKRGWLEIQRTAQESHRDPLQITPALQPYILVVKNKPEADQMLSHRLFQYFALLAPSEAWRSVGLNHPFGETVQGYIDHRPELHPRVMQEAGMAQADPKLAATGLIVGTVPEIVDQLWEYVLAGARYIVPQLPTMMLSQGQSLQGLGHIGQIANQLNQRFKSYQS